MTKFVSPPSKDESGVKATVRMCSVVFGFVCDTQRSVFLFLGHSSVWMCVCLNFTQVDLFSALYGPTDHLLCHNDELQDRRVAFILYLVDRDWAVEDGGLLEFFDTEEGGG